MHPIRQRFVLHETVVIVMFEAVHATPPFVALVVIVYVCVNWPPPQLLEHAELDVVATQLTATAKKGKEDACVTLNPLLAIG